MAEYKIRFDKAANDSLQVGDSLYSSSITLDSNGDVINVGIAQLVGEVQRISGSRKNIFVDVISNQPPFPDGIIPSNGDFIMFQKDRTVNTSGLKGYFAETKFTNGSSIKAELFDVGAETTHSSK